MNKKQTYWLFQVGGWLLFVMLNCAFQYLNGKLTVNLAIVELFIFLYGVLITHVLHSVIKRYNWVARSLVVQIPLVIISSLICGVLISGLELVTELLIGIGQNVDFVVALTSALNISFVVFFWALIYFLIHYVVNYKKAEIENLKWNASINEMELNKLKSQLNPHFMFNAMNSIRALVEENPAKAKESITQLSNILRNTLMMGKNKVISFDEEMKLVQDYVALESTRYEERLSVSFDIDPASSKFSVPPLMIQTLVENGIKHGISKLPQGGKLSVTTELKNDDLLIKIENSGRLNETAISETGFGLKNSQQRLSLLYGDKASLTINNINGSSVLTELLIPQFQGI